MIDKTLTQQDVMQILELVRSAPDVAHLRLRYGDFEIELSRTVQGVQPSEAAAPAAPRATAQESIPAPQAQVKAERPAHAQVASGDWEVRSPMVGTCYMCPEPGAKPFVSTGDRVEADTAVCIVEVMKLMNTVSAGRAGMVKSIHFEDGQAVEYGQLLVVIATE